MKRPVLRFWTAFLFAGLASLPAPAVATAKNKTAAREQWLRQYALSPYGQYWTATLKVSSLDGDLAKVLDLMKSENADLTEPFVNFAASKADKVQQLSYRLDKKSAQEAVIKLGKLGVLSAPVKHPNEDLQYLPTIKAQMNALAKEKKNHPKALAAMPNTARIVDELLERLQIVEAVYEKSADNTLLNLTIQENK